MSVGIADILTGFKSAWDASVLRAVIPGGLWDVVPEGVSLPYAKIACVFKDNQHFSSAEIRTYRVTITVYARKSQVAVGGLAKRLLSTFATKASIVVQGATVLLLRDEDDSGGPDAAIKDAERVQVAARVWEVMLQV